MAKASTDPEPHGQPVTTPVGEVNGHAPDAGHSLAGAAKIKTEAAIRFAKQAEQLSLLAHDENSDEVRRTTEALAPAPLTDSTPVPASKVASQPVIDRSGTRRYGKASFYASRFGGRKMANGQRFSLATNNAASRTLPLGTTAKVTNLETGKSALVTIRDRGPYVGGRIIDLSPATARLIGISKKRGLASVEVTPVSFPDSHAGTRMASLR